VTWFRHTQPASSNPPLLSPGRPPPRHRCYWALHAAAPRWPRLRVPPPVSRPQTPPCPHHHRHRLPPHAPPHARIERWVRPLCPLHRPPRSRPSLHRPSPFPLCLTSSPPQSLLDPLGARARVIEFPAALVSSQSGRASPSTGRERAGSLSEPMGAPGCSTSTVPSTALPVKPPNKSTLRGDTATAACAHRANRVRYRAPHSSVSAPSARQPRL
jgi:hypothetical protein